MNNFFQMPLIFSSLLSLKDIENLDTKNVRTIDYLFNDFFSLESLDGLQKC